jgi:hypothetical protein
MLYSIILKRYLFRISGVLKSLVTRSLENTPIKNIDQYHGSQGYLRKFGLRFSM